MTPTTTDELAVATSSTPPPPTKALMTIAEFCAHYNISKGLYHKLRRAGRGPAIVEVLNAVRITPQAAEAWLARMQADSHQERTTQPGGMSSAHQAIQATTRAPRRATGARPTFPSGKPIGRPRKADAQQPR